MAIAVLALSGAGRWKRETDVSVDFFYDNVGSDGNWVEVGDYGYCLATERGEHEQLATVLGWLLGLHRCRLDLGFLRRFRMGHLSLRTLDAVARSRLVLGARPRMGTGLGFLAHGRRLCRLGAVIPRGGGERWL